MRSRLSTLVLLAALLLPLPAAAVPMYETSFTIFTDWGAGFQGEFYIHNVGTEAIDGWTIQFALAHPIAHSWNTVYQGVAGGVHTFLNAAWNGTILPGQTISFGFLGGTGNVTAPPSSITLNGISPVPEPGTFALVAFGLAGLVAAARRTRGARS